MAHELNEPCSQCGQPAARLIAALAFCASCAEAFLEPIRARVAAREITETPGIGFGRQIGPSRADWGPDFADLQCDVCEATWTGPIGESCSYCAQWLDLATETQRQRLLWPDLPDPQSDRHYPALQTWAKQLAAAVAEQIITEHQARAAWDRKVPDVAV